MRLKPFNLAVIYSIVGFCNCQQFNLSAFVNNNIATSTVAYWPFNALFTTRDVSGNNIHANRTTNNVALTTGPFGKANTAYETNNIDGMSYIMVSSSAINFNAGSFTLTAWVNFSVWAAPIFEYYSGTNSYQARLFNLKNAGPSADLNQNMLHAASTHSSQPSSETACSFSTWQFAALVYDSGSGVLSAYCDLTQVLPSIATGGQRPSTTSTISFGGRSGSSFPDAVMACYSAHNVALTNAQLAVVKQQCSLINQITCPTNCAPGTCTGSTNHRGGYFCTCQAGWTGYSCSTAICDPPCGYGGTCTAPNTCSCAAGWTGLTCSSAICSKPCMNGSTCYAPERCDCRPGTFGLQCQSKTSIL